MLFLVLTFVNFDLNIKQWPKVLQFCYYLDNFINQQVSLERFSSASEAVRGALRFFKEEETKKV
jgi:hypothetical protein